MKKEIYADVYYHPRLIGYGCRWSIVVGYLSEDVISDPGWSDCFCFPVKPTKKQIRKLKKLARLVYLQKKDEISWEEMIIDRLKYTNI